MVSPRRHAARLCRGQRPRCPLRVPPAHLRSTRASPPSPGHAQRRRPSHVRHLCPHGRRAATPGPRAGPSLPCRGGHAGRTRDCPAGARRRARRTCRGPIAGRRCLAARANARARADRPGTPGIRPGCHGSAACGRRPGAGRLAPGAGRLSVGEAPRARAGSRGTGAAGQPRRWTDGPWRAPHGHGGLTARRIEPTTVRVMAVTHRSPGSRPARGRVGRLSPCQTLGLTMILSPDLATRASNAAAPSLRG